MGTRNLISIKSENKIKVAKYCQWDGYPDGQGVDILNILRNLDFKKLKKNIKNIKELSEESLKELYEKEGITVGDFITMEEAERFKKSYPQLDRDMGAEIIKYVEENESPILFHQAGAGMEKTWCQWFYILDLDEMSLLVFTEAPFKTIEKDNYNLEEVELQKEKALKIYNVNQLPTDEDFVEELTNI